MFKSLSAKLADKIPSVEIRRRFSIEKTSPTSVDTADLPRRNSVKEPHQPIKHLADCHSIESAGGPALVALVSVEAAPVDTDGDGDMDDMQFSANVDLDFDDNLVYSVNRAPVVVVATSRGNDFSHVVHDNYDCKGCGVFPIVGIRYKSTTVNKWNLCETCENKNSHPEMYEPFLKLKRAKDKSESGAMGFLKGKMGSVSNKFGQVDKQALAVGAARFVTKQIVKVAAEAVEGAADGGFDY
ncbi:Aste57867_14463 [Aphanomyces stellatus]|uniref:Aste57867_14463 protein n=1 Tax=Aphanomyces stellatus TaxID=120398 RepID=A0A485L1T9_9STRA|nr:hypothetical protein As57867_014409 [Aphanomyces stellatus]VFT91285.1 Aste57867_14463 [Aphanomyces stellatus]